MDKNFEKLMEYLDNTVESRKYIMYLNHKLHKLIPSNYDEFCRLIDKEIPDGLMYFDGTMVMGSVKNWAKAMVEDYKENVIGFNYYEYFQSLIFEKR